MDLRPGDLGRDVEAVGWTADGQYFQVRHRTLGDHYFAARPGPLPDDRHAQTSVEARGPDVHVITFHERLHGSLGTKTWIHEISDVFDRLLHPTEPVDNRFIVDGVRFEPMLSTTFGNPACVAVTVGTTAENQAFLTALREVLA